VFDPRTDRRSIDAQVATVSLKSSTVLNLDPNQAWWPLAMSTELGRDRPLARRLRGMPLVLFRDAQGAAKALHDRCPHRHAPLSAGRVRDGEICCPYHGWRFDADGHCTMVPGLQALSQCKPLIPSLATQEAYGLIWVCSAVAQPDQGPVAPSVLEGLDVFFMNACVRCGLAEAAENFLDGFHTHFVHSGWIRRDMHRQTVRAKVRLLPNGIETVYSEEGLQSGFISRWLEAGRSESVGRFLWPGVAEIEYRSVQGVTLLVTAWLTPQDEGRVRIHARVATRRGWLPAAFKRVVLRHLFGVILRQDKTILEVTSANSRAFAEQGCLQSELHTSLDLLGPSIRDMLNGRWPDDKVEREFVLRL
jgi:phenylpropionate dioxygenase-like ring-hydroxylating dioxygenase large terminal subunit